LEQHDSELGHNAVVIVVKVAGVQGETAAQLNGVYEPVKGHSGKLSMYNGKPLFRKRNYTQRFSATWFSAPDAFWLRFAPDNTWKFSNTTNKDANNNLGLCWSLQIGKDQQIVAGDPAEADFRKENLRLLRLHMKNFPIEKWNIWNGSNAQVNAQMKCTCHEEEDMENEEGKMKAQEPVEEEVLSSCVWPAHVAFLFLCLVT
jgi:hypothetical protein